MDIGHWTFRTQNRTYNKLIEPPECLFGMSSRDKEEKKKIKRQQHRKKSSMRVENENKNKK